MKKLRLMEGDWVRFGLLNEDVEYGMIKLIGSTLNVYSFADKVSYRLGSVSVAPITLTPQILKEWFGMRSTEKWPNLFYWKGRNCKTPRERFQVSMMSLFPKSWTMTVYMSSWGPVVRLRDNPTVHELQHLFEALTGEQLERVDL